MELWSEEAEHWNAKMPSVGSSVSTVLCVLPLWWCLGFACCQSCVHHLETEEHCIPMKALEMLGYKDYIDYCHEGLELNSNVVVFLFRQGILKAQEQLMGSGLGTSGSSVTSWQSWVVTQCGFILLVKSAEVMCYGPWVLSVPSIPIPFIISF